MKNAVQIIPQTIVPATLAGDAGLRTQHIRPTWTDKLADWRTP